MSKNKVNKTVLIGSFFIVLGVALATCIVIVNNHEQHVKKLAIEQFRYNQIETVTNIPITGNNEEIEAPIVEVTSEIEYIALLEISKINLEQGLVAKDDPLNDVDKNIEILDDSDMPDIENGNVILAAHTGTSDRAYFTDLHKMQYGDMITLYYNQEEYNYKVVNMYEIEKTGEAHIVRDANKEAITLITCLSNTNKQLVVIGEIIDEV